MYPLLLGESSATEAKDDACMVPVRAGGSAMGKVRFSSGKDAQLNRVLKCLTVRQDLPQGWQV